MKINDRRAWGLMGGGSSVSPIISLLFYTDLSYNLGGSFVREHDSFNASAKINSQTITDNYIFLYSNNI